MRIIAGEARGRQFKTREGNGTRPTDSRARETLFNIIGERVVDARFLDLYAGSGGVGLEALSRGAESCIFVEQNALAVRCIRDNVKTLGYSEVSQVWQANVATSLQRLEEAKSSFDIIFADPPFSRPAEFVSLCESLDKCAGLLHNVTGNFPGIIVVQHHWKLALEGFASLRIAHSRRAGESLLTFLEF